MKGHCTQSQVLQHQTQSYPRLSLVRCSLEQVQEDCSWAQEQPEGNLVEEDCSCWRLLRENLHQYRWIACSLVPVTGKMVGQEGCKRVLVIGKKIGQVGCKRVGQVGCRKVEEKYTYYFLARRKELAKVIDCNQVRMIPDCNFAGILL